MSSQSDTSGSPRRRHSVIWGSEIPFRNPFFVGREAELDALRRQLASGETAVIRQPPQPIYGLGGIGKTELAAEYAHRFSGDYDVVWWIRADQEDSIRAALIGLGRRMNLRDFNAEDRDYSSRLVLDALQAGAPHAHWLLVFDNVTRPGVIGKFIPNGADGGYGHVIITSRLSEWQHELRTSGIEITEFAAEETIRLLRTRVPQLLDDEARRLAEVLGNLPLAAEHAAAYLAETGDPVQEYIEAFEQNAHELFKREADMVSAHAAVATTWSLASLTLTPQAKVCFPLLAFFSPEPISEEVLLQPGRVRDLPPDLAQVLGSRNEIRRAARELARFSLAKINGVRNVIQVHNVVQAVTRGRIEIDDPERAAVLRDTVHTLLAASDPGAPEKEQNDPIYERSIHHLVPSGALECANIATRSLIINQVRRLHLRGGYDESLSLGRRALSTWTLDFGPDDEQTLALAVEVGVALRTSGNVEEAYRLNSDTLERLKRVYGEEDDTYLICANSYGQDLRLLGRYVDALAHDERLLPISESVFGPAHFRTLNVLNNIAYDLRCVGRYADALLIDERTHADRERLFGYSDSNALMSRYNISRDLRRMGRYEDSLTVARELVEILETRDEPWRLFRLYICHNLGVALRRTGYYPDAREIAEDTFRRMRLLVGGEHRAVLLVATNLISDRRVTDDLAGAQEIGEQTAQAWEKVAGAGHPNTLATRVNLAVVLRLRGATDAARELNEGAVSCLRQLYSFDRPNTLVAMTNLASDLAAIGDVRRARDLGEQIVDASRTIVGEVHPASLGAAANLSLDLRATGDEEAARELRAKTLAAYETTLSSEHPQARRAVQHGRVNLDIEPMSI
jgi:tetratricopeptide (TPR) repeat protein